MTAISGGAAAVNDVLQGTDSFGETKEKMHVMKTFTPEVCRPMRRCLTSWPSRA